MPTSSSSCKGRYTVTMATTEYEEDIAGAATGPDGERIKEKQFWLSAFKDHLADVKAYSSSMELADVNGDDDYKLIVADANKKLKVFGGTSMLSVNALMAVPSAVCAFYMDHSDQARRPCVAVATGPHIFTYKSFRPLYRFSLPPVELPPVDVETWSLLKQEKISTEEAYAKLDEAKMSGAALSTRSIDFLALDNTDERNAYVNQHRSVVLTQLTCITCMTVLMKDGEEGTARGCLVIGTENGFLHILHHNASEVIKKIALVSPAVHIMTAGQLDVEYRIIVACRNGLIYTVKNGVLQATTIEPDSHPVAIARYENQIAVATTNNALHFYHLKGKRQASVFMPAAITNLCSISTSGTTKHSKAVAVALTNGEVRVYAGKSLLNKTQVYDVVTGMRFGRYGREDSTLVLVLKSGTILLKMLPRTTSLEPNASKSIGPPPEQDVPLKVPKRTNVYVEQTEREKQFGVDMHRVFQRDLCKLRLHTARAYVKMLTDGKGAVSYNTSTSVRLTAHVQGLGPLFRLKLNIQNTGTKALVNIPVIFTFASDIYRMPKPFLLVPCLVPSLVYQYEVPVECASENVGSDVIRVSVCSPSSTVPIITAQVTMPMVDALTV